MVSSIIVPPLPALSDITPSAAQQRNRSQPSPCPPPTGMPQKTCQSSPPSARKQQYAHCSSPPSAFRHPSAAFSSPNSARHSASKSAAHTSTQPTDAFTQWMDAVIPLAHSAPMEEQVEEASLKAEQQQVDEGSLQPYVVINPALLHDTRWAYRDLQLLCQRLGLGGKGDRSHLIHKLRTWNRTHFSSNTTQPNTAASNFALLCIAHNSGASEKYSGQLTPLKVRTPRLCDGSPRSALSGGRAGAAVGSEGKRRLSFSVFNGVKIIPPRVLQYDEVDDDGEEEEEEAEVAVVVKHSRGDEVLESSSDKQVPGAACRASCEPSAHEGRHTQRCVIDATESDKQCTKEEMGKRQNIQQEVQQQDQQRKGRHSEQALEQPSSLLLRRSARKRIPSRKLQD